MPILFKGVKPQVHGQLNSGLGVRAPKLTWELRRGYCQFNGNFCMGLYLLGGVYDIGAAWASAKQVLHLHPVEEAGELDWRFA